MNIEKQEFSLTENLNEITKRIDSLKRKLKDNDSKRNSAKALIEQIVQSSIDFRARISELETFKGFLEGAVKEQGLDTVAISVPADKEKAPKVKSFGDKVKSRIAKNQCTTFFEQTGKFCRGKCNTVKQKEVHLCGKCMKSFM